MKKGTNKRACSAGSLAVPGMLIAVEIVLSRFCSISAWNMKISLSFLPVALAAMLYGPAGGAAVGALGDIIGAVLFPIGPYFAGFTLTAALRGVLWGLLLRSRQTGIRLTGAVLFNQGVLSLLLTTLWISVLYGSPFRPLLVSRIPVCIVNAITEWAGIRLLTRTALPRLRAEVAYEH